MKLIGYYDSFNPLFLPKLMYIFVSRGFYVWKGQAAVCRILVKRFFNGCISSLISRMPSCHGTHVKTISFWSASTLCNIAWIYINRALPFFSSACKADSESDKAINLLFLDWQTEAWSLSRHEKGLFEATDDIAVAATFSSTSEPSVKSEHSLVLWCRL